MGYFGISDYYPPIRELDHWLRRRVRMCYWKQWRGVTIAVGPGCNLSSKIFRR